MRTYDNFDAPERDELVRIYLDENGEKTDARTVEEGLKLYIVRVIAPGPIKTLVLFVEGQREFVENRRLRNAQSDETHVWNDN